MDESSQQGIRFHVDGPYRALGWQRKKLGRQECCEGDNVCFCMAYLADTPWKSKLDEKITAHFLRLFAVEFFDFFARK